MNNAAIVTIVAEAGATRNIVIMPNRSLVKVDLDQIINEPTTFVIE
jgi:hypothetical protein